MKDLKDFKDAELQRLHYHITRIIAIDKQMQTEMASLIKDANFIDPFVYQLLINIETELVKRKLLINEDLYIVQKSIMKYLQRYTTRNGRSPSIKEIQHNVLNTDNRPISSTSVVYHHLKQLEKRGYIIVHKKIQRGIEIIKRL